MSTGRSSHIKYKAGKAGSRCGSSWRSQPHGRRLVPLSCAVAAPAGCAQVLEEHPHAPLHGSAVHRSRRRRPPRGLSTQEERSKTRPVPTMQSDVALE